jgi:hypothetical protein
VDSSVAVALANVPIFSALIFWSFIAVVSVAGMVKEFANKREVQRTLRSAIERNQTLDPAVVASIVSTCSVPPERFAVAGIIVMAAGVGLLPLGFFIGKLAREAFYPIVGSGCLAICVGLGLFGAAALLRRAAATGARNPM